MFPLEKKRDIQQCFPGILAIPSTDETGGDAPNRKLSGHRWTGYPSHLWGLRRAGYAARGGLMAARVEHCAF